MAQTLDPVAQRRCLAWFFATCLVLGPLLLASVDSASVLRDEGAPATFTVVEIDVLRSAAIAPEPETTRLRSRALAPAIAPAPSAPQNGLDQNDSLQLPIIAEGGAAAPGQASHSTQAPTADDTAQSATRVQLERAYTAQVHGRLRHVMASLQWPRRNREFTVWVVLNRSGSVIDMGVIGGGAPQSWVNSAIAELNAAEFEGVPPQAWPDLASPYFTATFRAAP
jgi:hypothetical protein